MRRQRLLRVTPRLLARLLLVCCLVAALEAQEADALKLTVTEGVNSRQDLKRGAASPVVVEVRDESGRIVPGARVQLTSGGSETKLAWTDTEGRAYLEGVIPLGQGGKFPIVADARFNGKLGTTTFNNQNVPPPDAQIARTLTFNRPNHKLRNTLIVAGVVGAAALAIALALTLGGSSAASSVPTSVSLGGAVVGGPR